MTTDHFLIFAWNWNPWVIAICGLTMAIYCLSQHSFRKVGWLLAGLVVFFLTLASPLDALANGYLFSAHMLQHLLLLLVVPALILLSLPPSRTPARLESPRWKGGDWLLRHPFVPWLFGVGGMWVWHAPALCNAAVTNGWVHRLQYVSLLLLGMAFWWPIIGPWAACRLSVWKGIAYLFSACLGCTILGILITFSPVEVCSIYLHPVDRLGILPLIQNQWGLTPAKDQQLGGLLMWVPACLVYFCGILGLFIRWHSENDKSAIIAAPQLNETFTGESHGN